MDAPALAHAAIKDTRTRGAPLHLFAQVFHGGITVARLGNIWTLLKIVFHAPRDIIILSKVGDLATLAHLEPTSRIPVKPVA